MVGWVMEVVVLVVLVVKLVVLVVVVVLVLVVTNIKVRNNTCRTDETMTHHKAMDMLSTL